MDHNIRCLDLCTACIGDIGGHKGSVFSCNCLVRLVKCFKLFIFHTTFFEETFYFRPGQNSRIRRILLSFHPFVELFVDVHNGIVGTVISESFFYESIKRISLPACGERGCTAEHFIYESAAKLLGIFGIIQKSVNICTAVVEYREKETKIRHLHDPVTDTVLDIICLCIVAQPCLGKVDRTDAAEDMVVDLIGSIKHFLTV